MTQDNLIFVIWFSLLMLILCTYGFYSGMIPLCDYLICLFLAVSGSLVAFFIRIDEDA